MKKVLIIGDSGIDRFQYGDCLRLSPEAPVPVFNPKKIVEKAGMAENVYENLLALNVDVDIITNKVKPIKTRIIDKTSNQMLVRIDENDIINEPISLELLYRDKWDFVIVSDYDKGFLNIDLLKIISTFCKKYSIPTIIDTKKQIGDWIYDYDFIKINELEHTQNKGKFFGYKNHLIVTLGENGAIHYDLRDSVNINTTYEIEKKSEVRDVSGAGDTFLCGFVVEYLKSNNIANAIKFANKCASYVVTQKGVVVVDINQI